jgi:hypothetical protein
METPLLNY